MFECLGAGIQEIRENRGRRKETVTSLGSGSGKGVGWEVPEK